MNLKIQTSLIKNRFKTAGKIIISNSNLEKVPLKNSSIIHKIDQIGGTNLIKEVNEIIIYGYEDYIIINGWAVDIENNCLPKQVWVEINGTLYNCEVKIPRTDVANFLNNSEFLQSGFQLKLPRIFIGEGTHKLIFHVISTKKYRVIAQIININIKCYPKEGYPLHTISGKKQEKDEIISHLYEQLSLKDNIISDLYNSYSWKVSNPLRFLVKKFILLNSLFTKNGINKLFYQYKKNGFKAFLKILFLINDNSLYYKETGYLITDNNNYINYLNLNKLNKQDIKSIRKEILNFNYKPLISVVTPVFNVDPKWLELCFKSLTNQYYPNWEFCLHDDASTNLKTIACLKKWEKKDKRIKISYGKENQHISFATNQAIKLASGEFIGLLDHDDEIAPDALFEVVKHLNIKPSTDFIYSDEDKLELNGERSEPYFKPDFNLDLFLSNNYICHFAVIRKDIGDKINWFRKGFEGSQDYDLFLRIIDITKKITHIPKVLYHWRKIPGSTAMVYSEKSYANKASLDALGDYIKRNKLSANVKNGLWPGAFRIKYDINKDNFVSIIIPFRDQVILLKKCVSSILLKTDFKNYEIFLINNNSSEKITADYLENLAMEPRVRIFNFNEDFNFSKINNWAVKKTKGNILLFLNNDTEIINSDWLTNMLEHIERGEVGAVGAKLLYSNDHIQHAGIILGVGGVASHAFLNFHSSNNTYYGNANVVRNYTACTGACLMIKKTTFNAIGGMDEDLKVAYNDIDLCMKIRKLGLLITYTPYAKLYHYESRTRGYEVSEENKKRLNLEEEILFNKWGDLIKEDPYYNKNLNSKKIDYTIKSELV